MLVRFNYLFYQRIFFSILCTFDMFYTDMTVFQCRICSHTSSSLANCVAHVYTHRSPQNSCVVPGCGHSSPRLTKHLKGSHRNMCEYPCASCKRVFVRPYDLKMHSNALHGGIVSYHQHVHDSNTGKAN